MKAQTKVQLATSSPSELADMRLEQDRLVVQIGAHEDVVTFSEISRINLQQTLGAFSAVIERRTGRPLMIRSRCVRSGMKVEDRVEDYAELLRQLHVACAPFYSSIAFVGGSTTKYWLGWVLLAISPGLLVLSAFAVADGRRSLWLLAPVAVGGFMAGLAGVKQGRGTPYDPKAPPATLLPPKDQSRDRA